MRNRFPAFPTQSLALVQPSSEWFTFLPVDPQATHQSKAKPNQSLAVLHLLSVGPQSKPNQTLSKKIKLIVVHTLLLCCHCPGCCCSHQPTVFDADMKPNPTYLRKSFELVAVDSTLWRVLQQMLQFLPLGSAHRARRSPHVYTGLNAL